MNVPFKFTFAATNDYGLLWNPHNLTLANSKANTVLTGLTEPSLFGLVPPLGDVYLEGLVVMTDDAGAVPFTVGVYDTVAAVFYALYPVLSTAVAGGGVADVNLTDLKCPLGKTRLLCLRNDGAGAGVVAGHVKLFVSPPDTSAAGSISLPLNDELSNYALLAEDGNVLLSENVR